MKKVRSIQLGSTRSGKTSTVSVRASSRFVPSKGYLIPDYDPEFGMGGDVFKDLALSRVGMREYHSKLRSWTAFDGLGST